MSKICESSALLTTFSPKERYIIITMKAPSAKLLISVGGWALVMASHGQTPRPYQPLRIPQLVTGSKFNLDLHTAKRSFWKGAVTDTFAYNQETFWGPTLVLKAGDNVTLNVHNSLTEETTTHWHGFHIPAIMDGGPHHIIAPGKTWSPHFKVMNRAGTYWYHPHAHTTTQNQLTMGAGGLIIVQDETESKLALPRTYGVDDIPLALTSRRFLTNQQFSKNGDNDKYGDYPIANGTIDAETTVPAQFVRLRILNAEIERGYRLGLSDNRPFYVIATDGGLVDKPIPVTRMNLMTGERVEILIDLSKDKPGSALDLMAYNSNQSFGFPGGEAGTTPPNGGYLNNIDFKLLHLNVGKRTARPILTLPSTLTRNVFPTVAQVNQRRTLNITAEGPNVPFTFDEVGFDMHTINQVVKLGATEQWTVANNQIFGHSFHIHDIQFKIIGRSDGPVEDYEQGWKDTLYVPRNESVTFLTRFDDFASDTEAFMYHCHMSNHEDGGLMGQFLVSKNPDSAVANFKTATEHAVTEAMKKQAAKSQTVAAPLFSVGATDGVLYRSDANKPTLLYFIEADCPCSREAARYFNRIQTLFAGQVNVLGVINANMVQAKAWQSATGAKFPLVADEKLSLIRQYRAPRSVFTTLIAPPGMISKNYAGYSQEMLRDITRRLGTMTEAPKTLPNFADAPKVLTAGCPFPVK
jgi:bilirubin oxidase